MLSRQIIQDCIEDITRIMHVGLCVYEQDGTLTASTTDTGLKSLKGDYKEMLEDFLESPADSQRLKGHYFYKLYEEDEVSYIIAAQSDHADSYNTGRLALSQLGRLCDAYREQFDSSAFLQKILEGDISDIEIHNRCKQLDISAAMKRSVFLIETEPERTSAVLEMVRQLYGKGNRDFVEALDERHIVLLRELQEEDWPKEMSDTANMLVDMVNVETMSHAYVSFGSCAKEMKETARAYREARLAMHVGKLFYSDKTVFAYNLLGIGRLIYQLPRSLCDMFLQEVFGSEFPKEFDEETRATINKFFQLNLNVSETARQLHLHRNTLTYRLEKIEKMTGLDIRSFEDAMTLKIALMVADAVKKESTDEK